MTFTGLTNNDVKEAANRLAKDFQQSITKVDCNSLPDAALIKKLNQKEVCCTYFVTLFSKTKNVRVWLRTAYLSLH